MSARFLSPPPKPSGGPRGAEGGRLLKPSTPPSSTQCPVPDYSRPFSSSLRVRMCSLGFGRSLGFALLPLAACCIVANVLLFFPDGQINYVQEKRLSEYVWYFMGIGGGGLVMLIPAGVFLGMGKCVDSCGTETCAMCGSVIAALVGLAGSGYCFLISAVALWTGPYCFTEMGWVVPFQNDGGKYLFTRERWGECQHPNHIVEWNVTLLCVLLGLSALEFLLCFLQFVSGMVHAVCRPCCYKQEYSLNA